MRAESAIYILSGWAWLNESEGAEKAGARASARAHAHKAATRAALKAEPRYAGNGAYPAAEGMPHEETRFYALCDVSRRTAEDMCACALRSLDAAGSPRREVERHISKVGGVRRGEQVVGVLPEAPCEV